MKKITNEQLDSLIRSAVNSSGPLPADEKFAQIISALRELRELRESNDRRGEGEGEGEWIEWGGGECPVDNLAVVEAKHRSEEWAPSRVTASVVDWHHREWCSDTDIIAYRVIES